MKRCFLSLICGVLITALFFIIPQSALAASDPYEYFYRQLFSGSLDDMLSYDDSDLDWPYSIYEIVRDNDLWYDPLPSEAEFSEYIDLMERKNGISMEQWHEMLMDFQWMYDIYSVPLYSDLKSRILPDAEQVYQYTHLLSSGLTISNGELMEIDSSQYYTETTSASFEDGSGLNVLVLDDDTIIDIGGRVFTESYGESYHLILPNSVDEISVGAFMDAPFISISMPSVTWLDSGAFQRCNLVQFEVPRGVTYLPDGVFRQCDNLSYIIIPPEVTDISPDFIQYSSGDLYNAKGVMPIIYGWKNTAAEQYALDLGLPFVPVGVDPDAASTPTTTATTEPTVAPTATKLPPQLPTLALKLTSLLEENTYLAIDSTSETYSIPLTLTIANPSDNAVAIEDISVSLKNLTKYEYLSVAEMPAGTSYSIEADELIIHIDFIKAGDKITVPINLITEGWYSRQYDLSAPIVTATSSISVCAETNLFAQSYEFNIESQWPFAARKLYEEHPDVYWLFEDKLGTTQDDWQTYRCYVAWYYLRADHNMQMALVDTLNQYDFIQKDPAKTHPLLSTIDLDLDTIFWRHAVGGSSLEPPRTLALYTLFHECGHAYSNINCFADTKLELDTGEMLSFVENYIESCALNAGHNMAEIDLAISYLLLEITGSSITDPADIAAVNSIVEVVNQQAQIDFGNPIIHRTFQDVVLGYTTGYLIMLDFGHGSADEARNIVSSNYISIQPPITIRKDELAKGEFWADYFAMTFMKNEEWDSFMRETLPNCMAAADSLLEELLADYR